MIKYMRSAEMPSPDALYNMTSALTDDLVGIELFRKLVNRYSGQGESEGTNKQVKKFRTKTRNKQSHAVTSAFMELDTTYRMIESRGQEPAPRKNLLIFDKKLCSSCLKSAAGLLNLI